MKKAMKRQTRKEYWTVWGNYQVCSRHPSFDAAKRAARSCERMGGAPHEIYEVNLLMPFPTPKRIEKA